MKALSLKQPFAELVVSGKKTIELRKWKTKFRGKFYVHASKNIDKKAMQRFGYESLPLGCLVGTAELVEVKQYIHDEDHKKDSDKHLADTTWGTYGFVLRDPQRIKPIPVNGSLNFWEVKGI